MILNLVNESLSDVKYTISKFPDGQQQIKITSIPLSEITIKSRLNNFMDLELIVCATASLKGLGVTEINLYAPYFLGSRSDRKFEGGSNNYLKDVICPIINSLKFKSITACDPHSDVLEACLNNFEKINNYSVVNFAFNHLYENKNRNFMLLSPDGGALKKVYKLAEQLEYNEDILSCSKSRGIDGKLTKTEVPHFDLTKDAIIVDDICDGGATFINIAKIIKERYELHDLNDKLGMMPRGELVLIVTHGIFSKGFSELEKYFDKIYCTNSYSDKQNWDLEFGNPSYSREAKFVNNRIHQLNIF